MHGGGAAQSHHRGMPGPIHPDEVGDIVHLWDHELAVCRAAVVTQTEALNHDSELHVFVPRKPAEFWFAVHDESKGDESWHWPCGEGQ